MTYLSSELLVVITCLLCFLPGTSAQSELITDLLLGNYSVNEPVVNYCANASVDYCENKNCSNGYVPLYGFTCIKPNGQLLPVNYLSKVLFFEAMTSINTYSSELGATVVSINDIQIDLNADTVTYVFGLSTSISYLGQVVLSNSAKLLAPSIGAKLGVSINPARIKIDSPSGVPQLSIELLFPTSAATITWYSATIGNLTTLRDVLLASAGLNASSPSAQIRLVTVVNGSSVTVKWIEDIALAPGVDKTYLSLGCLSFLELYNGTINLTATGFTIENGTIAITGDSSCVTHASLPVPQPVLQPTALQPNVPQKSSSTCFQFVLWHCMISLFLLLLF